MAQAAADERGIRTELLEVGYQPSDTFTPAPRLATQYILGDESWYDSAISHLKRQLDELGIGGGK
jgi:hypothetical protein